MTMAKTMDLPGSLAAFFLLLGAFFLVLLLPPPASACFPDRPPRRAEDLNLTCYSFNKGYRVKKEKWRVEECGLGACCTWYFHPDKRNPGFPVGCEYEDYACDIAGACDTKLSPIFPFFCSCATHRCNKKGFWGDDEVYNDWKNAGRRKEESLLFLGVTIVVSVGAALIF